MHALLHIELFPTEITVNLRPPLAYGCPCDLVAITLRVGAATVAYLLILLLRDTAIGPYDLMIVNGV